MPTVKFPVWLLPIARSITGAGFTVVRSEEELLAALLSPVVDTLAVLVTLGTAAAPTLTVKVMLLLPLFPAMGPAFVQVTTCALAARLHTVPVPLTKPSPVGSVSVTVIPPVVAVFPTLVTVKVYTPLVPTVKLPVWLLPIARSITGAGFTVVRSEEELLAALLSP